LKPPPRRRPFLVGAFEDLPAQVGRLDARGLPMPAQYAIALVAVVIAVVARSMLDPWLGERAPFLLVFAVLLVLVVAVCPGPFFLAAFAGGVATWYFIWSPRASFELVDPAAPVAIAIYMLTVACAWISTTIATRGRERERRFQEAAAQQREALRVTIASIGDAVIATDAAGQVEFLNDVAVGLTGWAREDAIGRTLGEVFHIISEETREPVESPADKVMKLGKVVGLANHTILVARDGRELPIDDSAAPIRDDGGRIVGVVLVFRDVTERRAAELKLARSERELADFFENATVGMHWIGPDGRILRANHAELRMLGYTADEYIGHHISEFHVDQPTINSIFDCLNRDRDLKEYPARLRCKDGSTRDVLISSSVYRENGEFIHTRCFTLDVTDRKRAEEALRDSEQRFRLMADAAPVLIWMSDGVGKFTWFNRRWLDFVGRTGEQERGDGWLEHVHPEDTGAWRGEFEAALAGRRAFSTEYRMLNAAGEFRWLLASGVPRFDAEGGLAGFIGSCVDITDRKNTEVALAVSEARFRRLADANLIGVGFGDGQGNVTYVNDEMLRMMGQRREDFEAGRVNWKQAIAPEYAETYRRTTETLVREGSVVGYEKAFLKPDGQRTYFLGAAALLEKGSNAHVRIALDLTELKRTQQERERLLEQLRETDRRKDEFLAVLAHELRNPLAPIKNSLEVIKRASSTTEVLQKARDTMERQVGHMVRLIDDLLDVSRITHDRLELRRSVCELGAIIAQAVQTVQPLADAKRHTIEVRLPPQSIHLDADAVRLTQVFINLLDNACKYSEPGGQITITAAKEGETQVAVNVQDNGAGIPEHLLSSVFDMFTRADQSLERAQGGLGLGLTLVRRMVELHGGSVEAHSAGRGHGSRFTVRLPTLEAGAALRTVPGRRPEVAATGRRILVVDDNRDATETLTLLLQLTGHQTFSAYDGASALAAAETFRPDLVMLDIGLPEMNGYEVARRVRAQPWGKDILLIALTGWGQEEDRRRSREAGFDAHIVKPVDHAQLVDLLTEFDPAQRARRTDAAEGADRAA
jgi:PAS domain S-box-containing protein